MKHFITLFFVWLLCGLFSAVFAQNYKFGHINTQELIVLMPERDSAQVKMETITKDLQEQIQAMQLELQTKYTTYQQKQATWTAAILEAKQKELQDLSVRAEEFQRTAQEELQRQQQLLLQPVIQKAATAIEKVAKQEGFTYVFDVSALQYFSPEQSIDVLPLVKKELNITKELPARSN
ncbi:MAG: OmpH family outer membrane protein [Prevotellaceae bacterium]|jgi:outer membrane protein|nr:OmpH family outer membrane protein [Prevotellaceae bacterium]